MAHAIAWFEIPCTDIDRAAAFYGTLFNTTLQKMPMGDTTLAMFPAQWDEGEIGGALIAGPGSIPSSDGTVVYLAGGEDLQVVLDRVPSAGGKVAVPKMAIPMEGAGFMAFFIDTEGNRVGVCSPN